MKSLSILIGIGPLFFAGCAVSPENTSADEQAVQGSEVTCTLPSPVPPPSPEWSYHEETTGVDVWGTLPGYETCDTGLAQSPIHLDDATTSYSALELAFLDYDARVPLDITDNGHTLQVNVSGGAATPAITYDGETYHLIQLHWHATSEHTLSFGPDAPLEVHLVHRTADGAKLAVVGVLYEEGAEDRVLAAALANAPGPRSRHVCSADIRLRDLLPADRSFYHYGGSLTTPTCAEGVSWFVMTNRLTSAAEQAAHFQERFHGTTNRPVQPRNGRVVTKFLDSSSGPH
ncbi:MAG: carbonic anhydrase family protein [Kofleriaceae bacterium]